MNTKKIFRCKHCGNIIQMIHDSSVKVVCCGEEMGELIANTVDADLEKHIPVVERTGQLIKVRIGENPHPMTKEHHIEWVYLETKKGSQIKYLNYNNAALVSFTITDDEPIAVYSYCNLHQLWKKEIKK